MRKLAARRRDIESARTLLDDMQQRLLTAAAAMNDFVERKRQVEQLEQRDVRSTVEVISARSVR